MSGLLPRTLHNSKITLGHISSAVPDMADMSPDPLGKMWTGITDPFGHGDKAMVNLNYGSGDGHATQTTGRSLPLGSTSDSAFTVAYMDPKDLIQVGRNLVFQTQQVGSPAVAVSTEKTSTGYRWVAVTRTGGVMQRNSLGSIVWGEEVYFVVETHIAVAGGAKFWIGRGAWPDVTKAPAFARSFNTDQGETGHNTIGQYSASGHPGIYRAIFRLYGRDTTPAGAIARAMAA